MIAHWQLFLQYVTCTSLVSFTQRTAINFMYREGVTWRYIFNEFSTSFVYTECLCIQDVYVYRVFVYTGCLCIQAVLCIQSVCVYRVFCNCAAVVIILRSVVTFWSWNVMAHSPKPDFVFRRNGRVRLNRRGGISSVDCWQPRCAHQR